MKLPGLALKNYQFVLIVIAMMTFLGVSSLRNMPRSEDPNPNFPNYNIVVVYPGAGPEDIEELVVNPIEEKIDQLDDITKIITTIEEGLVVIQVEAEFGIDIDEKYDEILREVKAVEPDLPEEIFSVDVNKFEPNATVKIHQIAILGADKTFKEFKIIGEKLEKRLEKLKAVDDAELSAYPEEEIKVLVDFQRMSEHNVSMNQLLSTLTGQNLNIPAGDINAGYQSFSVKSSGSFQNLAEIGNAVVKSSGNALVRINDIAEVAYGYEEDKWIGRYNGERAVFLSITQKTGNNLVQLGKEINAVITDFEAEIPTGFNIETVFEQAPVVDERIGNFFINLIQGVLLVGVIILIFLGFRSSAIIITVIPISVMIGIGILDMAEYALQQISIAALVIALGLLVDNGIVVVENVRRYVKMGFSLKDSAIKGTAEVGLAIVSSTATTLFAFLPLVFLSGGPGEFLRSLPMTIIFVMIVSLALALTFTPLLSAKLLKTNKKEKVSVTDRFLGKVIDKVYGPMLRFSLKRGWLVLSLGFISLFASASLFPYIGVSFFPTADKPLLLIEVETPAGSSMDRTAKAVSYTEEVLRKYDFVKDFTSNIGHGNPTIYYNRVGENYKKNHGQLLVNFESWNPDRFYNTLDQLRYDLALYADARITFQELQNGPPVEAPIEIRLIGDDLPTMKEVAAKVEGILSATEGVINIYNPLGVQKTDLKVAINRDKANMYGVLLPEIDQVIRAGVDGIKADELTFNQNDYDLIVEANYKKDQLDELPKMKFASVFGGQVPLNHVAALTFENAISEIRHYNTDRSTSITASTLTFDAVIPTTETIMSQLEKLDYPDGITYEIGGEYEGQQESFGDLGILLLLALIGIFSILVLQFRSLLQPLIVFAAIPLAITGSFIALFLTGWSFSFFAFVGFISLVGIVVNNSIILVDYTNQLIRGGKSKMEAITEAAKTRFTPIVLTSITTILGLVPLTFQATNLWSPLGWTIIGGMISSTILTLLIVPVLYKWFTNEKVVAEIQ
ncbi:MAG: efflux RND transporter permease subunit [Bacteroidota bacterium]